MHSTRLPLGGAGYLCRGFRALFDRRWRRLVVMPLAINTLLFGAGGVWAAGRVAALVRRLHDALPGWLDWLAFLTWPLFAIAFALVCVYGFTLAANVIGAPFNAVLAGRVLGEPAAHGRGVLADALSAVGNELRKLGYFLLRAVPLWLLLWVPGVNLLAGPAWLLVGAWLLALEYLDYPLAHRGQDFATVRRRAAAVRWPALGFGGGVLLLAMLPLVNLLLMPAAVIGACLLVRDLDQAPPQANVTSGR